jgi:hypothetical protein
MIPRYSWDQNGIYELKSEVRRATHARTPERVLRWAPVKGKCRVWRLCKGQRGITQVQKTLRA